MSAIFPKWFNKLPTMIALGAVCGGSAAIGGVWYYFTPKFYDVGYEPTQPGGGFSHQIHAGKLGMDCRYCHTKIESSDEANIPNVATCIGCHGDGKLAKLNDPNPINTHKSRTEFIREAYAKDASIAWRRVHKLPDYVRNFPHAAHLKVGVSCYSCHGRIDQMPVVHQKEPLSMGWCLDCHRQPETALVDPKLVTNLHEVESQLSARAKGETSSRPDGFNLTGVLRTLEPPQGCGACHY